ncbi:MAG: hypothetical protein M0Z61_17825 [Nitrospiraceae bacterium]|nr:hypothetical protein [Nitrospiraceae bacterium]
MAVSVYEPGADAEPLGFDYSCRVFPARAAGKCYAATGYADVRSDRREPASVINSSP